VYTRRSRVRLLAAILIFVAVGAACGTTRDSGGDGAGGADERLDDLRVMVPNTAGSGYDTTARTAALAMEEAEIANRIEVFNLAGAGGTVGLARLVNESGNGDLLMMMGLGVVGSVYTNGSEVTLQDTTAVARLIEEAGAIYVPAGSPFETIDDLVDAWEADPGGITFGGGSSPGGPDHLLPMQLAAAVGIEPSNVNYVGYDGAGELLPAILGEHVDVAASGIGEFSDQVEAGELRVLVVTSEEPIDGVDAPTAVESGIDLVFTNWRGLVAPPGIEQADRERLIGAVDRLHDSEEWQQALENNGWTDAYLTGDEFADFIAEQDTRVADVLTDLGLA
jgi:putative tricarboxylic transport membrane protein